MVPVAVGLLPAANCQTEAKSSTERSDLERDVSSTHAANSRSKEWSPGMHPKAMAAGSRDARTISSTSTAAECQAVVVCQI